MASSIYIKHFLGAPSSCDGPVRLESLQSPSTLQSPSLRLPARRSQFERLEIQASGSTFGTYFQITTFGESHGGGVGCVIDGCPPRLPLSEADMQIDLDRRRPGQSRITTPRKETDTCKIASGIADGRSAEYRSKRTYETYDFKYGGRSIQGGGRSSARETIGRVAAVAVAKKILKQYAGTEILAYVPQVHTVVLPENLVDHETVTLDQKKMIAAIDAVRVRGDSIGGVFTCIVRNVPHGLGSLVFDKLETELAKAVMSLPATKGFEFGSGFTGTFMTGSEHNDEFYVGKDDQIVLK